MKTKESFRGGLIMAQTKITDFKSDMTKEEFEKRKRERRDWRAWYTYNRGYTKNGSHEYDRSIYY